MSRSLKLSVTVGMGKAILKSAKRSKTPQGKHTSNSIRNIFYLAGEQKTLSLAITSSILVKLHGSMGRNLQD